MIKQIHRVYTRNLQNVMMESNVAEHASEMKPGEGGIMGLAHYSNYSEICLEQRPKEKPDQVQSTFCIVLK